MALSSSDITNKLSEYINYFESNGNYWNGNQTLSRESWGVSDTPCSPSCNPNQFAGGIQCYAFARFIAYLLTGVVVENEDVGGWKKHTSFHNYSIKPGDIVDVDDSNGEHHAIVHRINDNGTIEFLELWSSAVYGCLVAHGQFNGGATWNVSTEAEIKSIATQIMECPPIEEGTPAPVPGSTPTPTTVSVTLHNVNAAGSTMTMTATYGQPYGNVLAPLNVAGYTFKGWYTEPNGGGTKYTFSSTVNQTTAHSFYAYFEGKQYTVTLHNVNAAGSTMTMTATYGQPYGNVLAPLNVAGYTFKGWYTEPNGGGTKYTFMSNVDRVGNHIFYAHFVEQE